MDIGAPYADLISGLEGPILEVLAGTSKPLTGRRVQSMARRGGVAGVNEALRRLVRTGLVLEEPAGRAILYRANRDHVAWPVVQGAVGIRLELLRRIAVLIDGWLVRPQKAILFGSAARGDGGPDSDIDVFLVRDDDNGVAWVDQVHELTERVRAWSGNELQAVDVDAATWSRMERTEDPIVRAVQEDGIDLLARRWRQE